MTINHRVLLGVSLCLAACGGPPEGDAEDAVAKKEDQLVPLCFDATFSAGPLSESVDLWFAGSRNDASSSQRVLSPPSAWSSTLVTATFGVGDNFAELFAAPLAGFAAGGFNLDLTVRDPVSGRVLCNRRQEVLSRSTPAGSLDVSAPTGNRTLTCGFDAQGLTAAPVARATLEVWGTAGGLATAFVRARVPSVTLAESRCLPLLLTTW